MKVLIKEQKNSIACIAIGTKIFNHWKKNIFPFWKVYCKKNNLGLIVFTHDLIKKNDPNWKKPTGKDYWLVLKKNFPKIENICILDLTY